MWFCVLYGLIWHNALCSYDWWRRAIFELSRVATTLVARTIYESLSDSEAFLRLSFSLSLHQFDCFQMKIFDLESNADHFRRFRVTNLTSSRTQCRLSSGDPNVVIYQWTATPSLFRHCFYSNFPLLCHCIFNVVFLRSSPHAAQSSFSILLFPFISLVHIPCYTIFFDESKQLIGFLKS